MGQRRRATSLGKTPKREPDLGPIACSLDTRVVWDPEFGGSRSGTGPELLNFAGPGQVPGPEL